MEKKRKSLREVDFRDLRSQVENLRKRVASLEAKIGQLEERRGQLENALEECLG